MHARQRRAVRRVRAEDARAAWSSDKPRVRKALGVLPYTLLVDMVPRIGMIAIVARDDSKDQSTSSSSVQKSPYKNPGSHRAPCSEKPIIVSSSFVFIYI